MLLILCDTKYLQSSSKGGQPVWVYPYYLEAAVADYLVASNGTKTQVVTPFIKRILLFVPKFTYISSSNKFVSVVTYGPLPSVLTLLVAIERETSKLECSTRVSPVL
jgi:hypothetical protein